MSQNPSTAEAVTTPDSDWSGFDRATSQGPSTEPRQLELFDDPQLELPFETAPCPNAR